MEIETYKFIGDLIGAFAAGSVIVGTISHFLRKKLQESYRRDIEEDKRLIKNLLTDLRNMRIERAYDAKVSFGTHLVLEDRGGNKHILLKDRYEGTYTRIEDDELEQENKAGQEYADKLGELEGELTKRRVELEGELAENLVELTERRKKAEESYRADIKQVIGAFKYWRDEILSVPSPFESK